MNIDNKPYDIQYSGNGSILQRFTITSSEPIVGQWKITIVKDGIEQAGLENSVYLKIKYLKEATPTIISLPK
jgi:hypothetical protein